MARPISWAAAAAAGGSRRRQREGGRARGRIPYWEDEGNGSEWEPAVDLTPGEDAAPVTPP
uniref:Uncharacterized protein n=1 Tax=Oryza rufipogon TaxID=4529 RepID=A0A0E0NMH9_ORYRU